ncbi:hypothetical protein C9395_10090, partial [Xanthomonas vasicola pv. vasculorum]
GVAILHRLHFQRALYILCLMRLRVAWTGRLLQRVRCQVCACMLVLWLPACALLLQLRTRRMLSQRGILSVRL